MLASMHPIFTEVRCRHVVARPSPTSEWADIDVQHDVTFAERYGNLSFALSQPVTVTDVKLRIEGLRKPTDLRCRHTFCAQLGEWRLLVASHQENQLPQHQLLAGAQVA